MEQGEAVEIGTYNELMAKKGKFYELKALNEMNLKSAEEGLN
jgi:ABC-type multidrug transport system fused ATPase/permease subunit